MNHKKYLQSILIALALIMIGALLISCQNDNSDREPVSEGTDNVVQEDTETNETPEEDGDEPTEIADLPPLPQLDNTQVAGFGGGGDEAAVRPQSGGGGAVAEGAALDIADSSFIYTDPFSGTVFTLNATLPTDPRLATVLQNVPDESIAVDQALDLVARFGFPGPLYQEHYPVEFAESDYVPPTIYHAFDGPRSLVIDPWGVYYNDSSVMNDFENPMPFEQAVPIAEAFLNDRGLLDFEYEVQQLWGTEVHFVRKIDGRPVNQPEMTVGVSHDGQIYFASYQALRNGQILGRYPLISAEAAWEILQSGVVENNIPYMYGIGPEFAVAEPAVPFEDPFAELYQFWMREYAPGDEIHLYEWPIAFLPVNSDAAPRIHLRNFLIEGDAASLAALAEHGGQQVHIWGQVGPEGETIQLAGWEAQEQFRNPISSPGVISRVGDQVLFTSSEDGAIYIVPEAPADLEDGLEVYLFAWAARDLGQAYPVLDWENIEKVFEFPEDQILDEPVVIEEPEIIGEDAYFEPFTYETFTVNEVSLAYYYSYVWPTDSAGAIRYEGQPTAVIQPTWKFSGETDTGEVVDFFVQAIEAQFLDN